MVARGGSKSIINKNLQIIGEDTLIALRAKTAIGSDAFFRLILSTDSQVIAEEGARHGFEVPFMRPSILAGDEASSADVVIHALEWLKKNDENTYDGIFLVEPSSPFCRVKDILKSISLFESKNTKLVASVVRAKVNSIHLSSLSHDGDFSDVSRRIGILPTGNRQQHKPQFYMNGCVYLFSPENLFLERSIFPIKGSTLAFEMPLEHSIEIDEQLELDIARYFWESGKVTMDKLMNGDLD